MDSGIAALSHQVFGPSQRTNEGRVRSQAEGIVERLRIYTWPKGINSEERLAFLSAFSAYGRSDDISPSAWATWAFSYVVLCFPEIKDAISTVNGREYVFEKLPVTYIRAVINVITAAENYDESQPEEYVRHISDIAAPPGIPAMPRNVETFPPDLGACATVPSVYGFCALLIFLAGKKINERNVSVITEKRPMNLVNAFKMDEYSSYILVGPGKMQTAAHENVNQAWLTYTHVRSAVVTEVAAFSSGASLPQRIVYTLTKLMEYSGMQPAYFIHRFLQAMPQAAEYSCIRPSLNAYISSVREVAGAPSYLQPYYKLIHGDGTRAFHRNNILTLSSCAIAWEKFTSPSMNNFQLGEGATAAVNMFDAEAASKGHPTLQSLTFVRQEQDIE